MKRWFVVGLVASCVAGDADRVRDTDVAPQGCDGVPELQFHHDVAMGPFGEDEGVDYGTPPQGGAPYSPFEVRMRGPYVVGERWPLEVVVRDRASQAVIGQASQSQAFLCANTGVHDGWWFGGEIHARFSGAVLEDLQGTPVDVTLTLSPPEGEVLEVEGGGTLQWTLGPDAP